MCHDFVVALIHALICMPKMWFMCIKINEHIRLSINHLVDAVLFKYWTIFKISYLSKCRVLFDLLKGGNEMYLIFAYTLISNPPTSKVDEPPNFICVCVYIYFLPRFSAFILLLLRWALLSFRILLVRFNGLYWIIRMRLKTEARVNCLIGAGSLN